MCIWLYSRYAMLAIAGLIYTFSQRPRRGERVNEQWETSNKNFTIRVTAYAEENGGFVGGAYYVFQSSPAGSNAPNQGLSVAGAAFPSSSRLWS